jgi:hypothetical protein
MEKSKVIYEKSQVVTNHETGEITAEQTEKITILPKEPPYIKVYLEDIAKIQDLPAGSTSLLYELLKMMNYETNEIFLNSSLKKRIAEKLGIKNTKSIDNALTQFHQSNILIRIERGIYMANPNLFGKGTWQQIHKLRKFSIRLIYGEDGSKEIQADIDFQLEQAKQLSLEDSIIANQLLEAFKASKTLPEAE